MALSDADVQKQVSKFNIIDKFCAFNSIESSLVNGQYV